MSSHPAFVTNHPMQSGRPEAFFATALEHKDVASFEDVEILSQVCMVTRKNNVNLIFLSDSKHMARVAFGDDVDIQQFAPNTIVALKSFTIKKKMPSGVISMELRDWEIAGHAMKLYGPPAKTLFGKSPAPATSDLPLKTEKLYPSTEAKPANSLANSTNNELAKTSAKPKPKGPRTYNGTTITTVEAISPYLAKTWQAEVRATRKSDVREYMRNQVPGKVFNLTFTDETGEIQATGFGEDSVAKFYDQIVEGQTYMISQFDVRPANKSFNKTGHTYELIIQRDSRVEHVPQAEAALPTVFFRFVASLADLPKVEVDSNVDVIGVALQVSDAQTLTSRANIPYTKRDILLVDDSQRQITLTLWGAEAENFTGQPGAVVAGKALRLSSFKGLSLSATRAAHIYLDPDEPRAHQLKGWFQATNGGSGQQFEPVSADPMGQSDAGSARSSRPRETVQSVAENRLGFSADADYFTVKARVWQVKQRVVAYPACALGDCKKKVVEDGGQWRCEKCQAYMDAPKYRFILTMLIDDCSSPKTALQVSVFDEVGRQLLGDTAQELQEMKGFGGPQDYNRELADRLNVVKGNEYLWDIKGSLEEYNGEDRARFTVMGIKPINGEQESLRMLEEMGIK